MAEAEGSPFPSVGASDLSEAQAASTFFTVRMGTGHFFSMAALNTTREGQRSGVMENQRDWRA